MLAVEIKKQLKGFALDVSFAVGDELVAIFGPSGSGKSLTLRCVAGLLKPDAGRIVVNGRPVFDSARGLDLRPQDRRVGYVFQNYALLPHLSVWDNIAYGLHKKPKAEQAAKVEGLIATMRLGGLERRRPGELSGGQQQRVALARALAPAPDVLLLDEPFSALDSAIRSRLHTELLHLLRELPVTTVLVTHNLNEAYSLSERMVVLDAGRVLQSGPREEVLRRPASRAVARFTGTKNLLHGTVRRRMDGHLEVAVGEAVVRAPAGLQREGEEVDLCIRPEEVMLIRPERGAGPAVEDNRYLGEIVGEIAHGPSFTLQVKLTAVRLHPGRDYDLLIDLPANVYYRLGVDRQKHWAVCLKRDSIHVIDRAATRQGAGWGQGRAAARPWLNLIRP
mgnify:CR=1 FL=1